MVQEITQSRFDEAKQKMSISQRKPVSSLMLQFRLKIKEVQINEETFSSNTWVASTIFYGVQYNQGINLLHSFRVT